MVGLTKAGMESQGHSVRLPEWSLWRNISEKEIRISFRTKFSTWKRKVVLLVNPRKRGPGSHFSVRKLKKQWEVEKNSIMMFPGMVLKQYDNFCKVCKYIRLKITHPPFHSKEWWFLKGAEEVGGGEKRATPLYKGSQQLCSRANSTNKVSAKDAQLPSTWKHLKYICKTSREHLQISYSWSVTASLYNKPGKAKGRGEIKS